MRIASGVTDQYVYFVAVDSTDFTTRETGLTTFTVYRSRNGGAATAMTTPTINEVDATNMPGVYELLLDEDMTIDAGDDTQEMVFHITQADMAPVTRTIELYRPKFTAGSTLSLADINAECDTAVADAALATAANLATVDTNVDAILLDTATTIPASITALNDLDAAGVRSAVGLATGNLDTQLSTIDTVVDGLQTDLSNGTDGLGAIKTAVDGIPTSTAPTAAAVAGAVWDEATTGHTTAGTFGEQVKTDIDAILVDTGATIPASITALNDLSAAEVNAEVDTALADYDAPTKAELDSGFAALNDLSAADVNAEVDTALSDYDAPTKAELDAGLAALNDISAADVAGELATYDAPTKAEMDGAFAALNDLSAADVAGELATYDGPTNTEMTAAFAEIKGATFSGTTDSLEAIRDRGDAAWTTGVSAPSAADIRAEIDSNSTQLAAIVADTDELQTNQGDWATATGFATSASITALNDFDPATDTVDVGAINGSTEAAIDLAASAGTIVRGAAEAGTLSTTQMTTDLAEVTDDHYNGRVIIWTSGVLKDQATNITSYLGATGRLTYTATTVAPSAADTFVIV